jgi:hypothetical protein
LHAAAVEFQHPETHELVRLQTDLSTELQEFLSQIER